MPIQSDANLYSTQFSDVSYSSKRYDTFHPSALFPCPAGTQLTFDFPPTAGQIMRDYSDSYMVLKVRLKDPATGRPPGDDALHVVFANNAINSIFSSVKVSVGNKDLTGTESRHEYSSFVANELWMDFPTRLAVLSSAGYSPYDGGAVQNNVARSFIKRRKQMLPYNVETVYCGKLDHVLASSSTPMPPGIPVKFVLQTNSPERFIQQEFRAANPLPPAVAAAPPAGPPPPDPPPPPRQIPFTYEILSCCIKVKLVELTTAIFDKLCTERAAAKKPFNIYFTRYLTMARPILLGEKSIIWNGFQNMELPQSITVCFVRTCSFDGDRNYNALDFIRVLEANVREMDKVPYPPNPLPADGQAAFVERCYVQKVTCCLDNQSVTGDEVCDTYIDQAETHYRLLDFCGYTNTGYVSNTLDILRYKHGLYFRCFDLTNNWKSYETGMNAITRTGRLSVIVEFSKGVTFPVHMLVIPQYRAFISIDKDNKVTKSYTT